MASAVSDKPKLCVQLINKPLSPRTGIGRYADEIERGLRNAGVTLRSAQLRVPVPQPVRGLGRRAGYDLDTFFQTYPLRAQTKSGYITHLTSQTLGILLLTQRLPRPVVVTVHDILPYMLRDDPELNIYRNRTQRLMDGLAMRGLQRADRLIADSHYTKSTLIDALGVSDERITVVHLGIDTEHFRPLTVPESFRDRYQLPRNGRYLLHVGSEDPRKNLPLLLRAFAEVRRDDPDLILLRVGLPAFAEQRQAHLRLAAELGVADAVRWLDAVPEEDLPLFYNLADVFAFPSLYEGFGFPVLEALACGTAVVAIQSSSVAELTGPATCLDPSADVSECARALCQELRRADEASEDERAARRAWAIRFDWSKTVTETTMVYQSTFADSRRRANGRAMNGYVK